MAWRSGFDRRTGVRCGGAGFCPGRGAAEPSCNRPRPLHQARPTTERNLNRTEKREFIESLAAVFADTSFVLVGQNKGLTVAQVSDLRRRMRAAGATYKVAKNRLATRAMDGTRFQGIAPLMKGPTALAWSTDPVAVAKTAVDYAKGNDRFVILGGALGDADAQPRRGPGAGRAALAGDAAGAAPGADPDPGHAHRRGAAGAGVATGTGVQRLRQEGRGRGRGGRRRRPDQKTGTSSPLRTGEGSCKAQVKPLNRRSTRTWPISRSWWTNCPP